MTLRTGNHDDIREMFRLLETATKHLYQQVISIAHQMNGSIQYDDLMWRTPFEKDLMETHIIDHFKAITR